MPKISLIAAVDEGWGIGHNNQLLCYLPADLRYFKEMTYGKPIIMGRKTFLSIGKALPGRQNIILSQHLETIEEANIAASLEEAIGLAQSALEIMVIGGGSVYQSALPLATDIYLTKIAHRFAADAFFPALDLSEWVTCSSEQRPRDEKNPYDLTFLHLTRKAQLTPC